MKLVPSRLAITSVTLWASFGVAIGGCHGDPEDPVSVHTGALSGPSAASILGFESSSLWNAGATPLGSSTVHSQGARSLSIAAKGYVPIKSVPLPAPVSVGATISVDLLLPTAQPNPSWLGALQVYVNSPSSNVYNAYVGQVELTSLPTNAFETLRLAVPPAIQTGLKPQATDVTVTIALNVPSNATGTYLLDNLVLSATATCNAGNVGLACNDGNVCTGGDVCTATRCAGQPIPNCTATGSPATPTVEWGTSPLSLTAYFPTCNSPNNTVTAATINRFPIPATIAVHSAAAATAVLQVSGPTQTAVQCTYSAPASSTVQTKQATLTSCSDGSVAGSVRDVTTFSLSITAAPGVKTPGDGVCADSAVTASLSLGINALPLLPEPISATDTATLRASFSWANTKAVPELDSQGRPFLYYAIVYVENHAQVGFLDQMQIHHDFLPILEGLTRWRGMRGIFGHRGDGKGVYTFAIMTGNQYNFIRQKALAGTVIFNAVNLRTPPPAFANPDGQTISYRALANIDFHYRGIDPVLAAQQPPAAPILCALDVSGGVQSAVQDAASAYHDVSNFISGLIGDAASVITSTTDYQVSVSLLNTDPTFNIPPADDTAIPTTTVASNSQGFTYTPLVQAWGRGALIPIALQGITIESRGVTLPSYSSGTADVFGRATVTFNNGVDNSVCLLLQNNAANVIDFITTAEMCDFGSYNTDSQHAAIALKVAADYTNVLAALTDNASFTNRILNFVPASAKVLVGQYADLMPNALTPCFTINPVANAAVLPTLLSLYATYESRGEDAVALLTVGDCIYESDMIVPSKGGWAASRGVTAHETGHWDLCNMIGSLGVATAYNAAIVENIPPIEVLGECDQHCGNEGFADFIADQESGGTNYFQFHESVADIGASLDSDSSTRGRFMSYCPVESSQCFDDNVGGPGQLSRDQGTHATNMGRFTATLHDFVDGVDQVFEDFFANGAYWTDVSTAAPNPLASLSSQPTIGGDKGDENIKLSPSKFLSAIMDRRGISIDQDAIFGALADQAKAAGYSWCDLCQLFALHQFGLCTQVSGEPDCATTMAKADLYSACTGGENIPRWIGAPPSSSDPTSCLFIPATSCPAGQIISDVGACITPPCPNGLVQIGLTGECVATCPPQLVRGKPVIPPVINGICQVIIG